MAPGGNLLLLWSFCFSLNLLPASEEVDKQLEEIPEQQPPEDPSEKVESPSLFHRRHITGQWGGVRPSLLERGLNFEFVYTGDVFSTVSGGIRRKTEYLANVDLILEGDLEKLAGWTGGGFRLYGLGLYGGKPSENAGDAQFHDNIEAPDSWKVFEAWLQQELLSGDLSILAGLYDLNSEFDVIETAGLFINSSHGIGADFAQSGGNGPSIFPVTSLAVRVKARPWENVYAQLGIFDALPGDPENSGRTWISFSGEDGILLASEVGLLSLERIEVEEPHHRKVARGATTEEVGDVTRVRGKLGLGFWFYSARFLVLDTESSATPEMSRGNHGIYLLGEHLLWREPGGEGEQGLSGFLRLGIADSRYNQFGYYTGGGLTYTGLIPGRDEDQVGLAVAAAYNGQEFKNALRDLGGEPDVAEVALEFTYRAPVTGWAVLQGDLQHIWNPSATGEVDDALVLGLRFELHF